MKQVCDLFEHECNDNNLFEKIIMATNNIGINWPSKKKINKYMGYSLNLSIAQIYWPKLVVAINKDKDQQITFLQKSPILLIRASAVDTLVHNWPDKETYSLLTECSVQDKYDEPRNAALRALAKHWNNKETREFLTERAVQDKDRQPRNDAFRALAEHWPDKETDDLLKKYIYSSSFVTTFFGKKHSEFGSIIFKKYLLRGISYDLYLDPRKAISKNHIEQAGKQLGITKESLSEYLGWDITKGSAHKIVKK